MKIGYARVSTKDQNLDLQIDALKKEGCDRIYQEVQSASKESPILEKLLNDLREGDQLIIYKLDRLGRSLSHLLTIVNFLTEKKVELKSIKDPIDTSSSYGKLIFGIFASLAEFERDLIRERTKAGIMAARARGKNGGRPKGLTKDAKSKAAAAEALYKEKQLSINEILQQLNISKNTFYKYLKLRKVFITPKNKVFEVKRKNDFSDEE